MHHRQLFGDWAVHQGKLECFQQGAMTVAQYQHFGQPDSALNVSGT